jgi:hypothetical protein
MSDIFKNNPTNNAGNTKTEWTPPKDVRFVVENPKRDIKTENGVIVINCFPYLGEKTATVITFPEKIYDSLMKSLGNYNSFTGNPVGKQEKPVVINVERFNPNKQTGGYFQILDNNYDPNISASEAHEKGQSAGRKVMDGVVYQLSPEIPGGEVKLPNGDTYMALPHRNIKVMSPAHSARIDRDCLHDCGELINIYEDAIKYAEGDPDRLESLRQTKKHYEEYPKLSLIERGFAASQDMRNNRKGIDPTGSCKKNPMGFGLKITNIHGDCWNNEDIPASQKINEGTRFVEFKAFMKPDKRVPTFHEIILDNLKIDASSENYEKVMGASLTEEEYNELGSQGVAEILYKKMNEITVKEFVKNFREVKTDEFGNLQIVKKDVYDQSQSAFDVLCHLETMTDDEKKGTVDNPYMVEIIPMMQFRTGSQSYAGIVAKKDNWRGLEGQRPDGKITEINPWVVGGAVLGQINPKSGNWIVTGLFKGQAGFVHREEKTIYNNQYKAIEGYVPKAVPNKSGVKTIHTPPNIADVYKQVANESIQKFLPGKPGKVEDPAPANTPAPGM